MAELHVDTNLAAPSAAISDSAVVEAFLSALRSGDLDGALSLLADDIEYQNVPLPRDQGKPQVERTLRKLQRFTPTFDVTMHHIAERDGFVLTERTDYLRGPWLDLGFWVCGTFEVRDGKIVLWRDYFDLATVVWQALSSPFRRLVRARSTPQAV